MIDRVLRSPKERLLIPAAVPFRTVSPVKVTLAALVVGIGAAIAAGLGAYGWALALWLLNRFLDGLDGEVARLENSQSDRGGYFDILADFVVYAAIPLALVLSAPSETSYLCLALLLASFYVNTGSWMYLAAILEKRGRRLPAERTSIAMPTGLIEGAETILFYCLLLAFPQEFVPLAHLMTILVAVTIIQRIVWAARHLQEA